MDIAAELTADGLEQHHHPVALQAARRGSCHAALNPHIHHQQAREQGPGAIIGRSKTTRGCVTENLEGAIHEGTVPGGLDLADFQVQGRDNGTNRQRSQIKFEYRILERLQRPGDHRHENQGEVDGGQQHEDHGNQVDQIRMETADGLVPGTETARCTNAESMVDGVESAHTGQAITQESEYADSQVHRCENDNRLVRPRTVAFTRQGGKFHIGQPQADRRRVGNHQQQEDHDSQTADKMRGGSPEQQTVRKRFHIAQDGTPRSGETGNAFEKGVDNRKGPSPEGIGQHSEDKGQQPGQENDDITVFQGNGRVFPDKDEREDAYDEGDRKADHQRGQRTVVPICHGNQDGQEHEQRTDQQREAHITRYHPEIHFLTPVLRSTYPEGHSPGNASAGSLR